MKCPTCGKQFGAKIYQCSTGHSSCENCKNEEKLCGQCLQPLTDVKNYALQEYIAGLNLKSPCPNEGCKLKFKEEEISAHLKECLLTDNDCPMKTYGKCEWKGKVSDMPRHFKSNHPANLKATVDQELILNTDLFDQLDISSGKQMNFVEIGQYKFFTILLMDKTKSTISMAVKMLATTFTASKWFFELHIYSKQQPIRKITVIDICKSISTPIEENTACILPLTLIKTYYNERIGGINYKFFLKQVSHKNIRPSKPDRPQSSLSLRSRSESINNLLFR